MSLHQRLKKRRGLFVPSREAGLRRDFSSSSPAIDWPSLCLWHDSAIDAYESCSDLDSQTGRRRKKGNTKKPRQRVLAPSCEYWRSHYACEDLPLHLLLLPDESSEENATQRGRETQLGLMMVAMGISYAEHLPMLYFSAKVEVRSSCRCYCSATYLRDRPG